MINRRRSGARGTPAKVNATAGLEASEGVNSASVSDGSHESVYLGPFCVPTPALLLGVAPSVLAAQDHDLQQWTLLVAQGPIKDDLLVQAEIQPRLTNDASRLGQFQISPAIGYRVSKKATVFVGYMFVHTDPVDHPAFDEHRIYQHVVFPVEKIGDVTVTARTRMEARTVVGAKDLAWRFRQQVRAQMPFEEGKGSLLVVWSEGFLNLERFPITLVHIHKI